MKIILIAFVAFLAGIFLSAHIFKRTSNRLRQKAKNARENSGAATKKKVETTKKVIWICLANGFSWVWCSYILAILDKVQIAESLSQVAVTEIIGVVLAYSVKSGVENLSKNNRWPDKSDTGNSDNYPENGCAGPEPERAEPTDVGI